MTGTYEKIRGERTRSERRTMMFRKRGEKEDDKGHTTITTTASAIHTKKIPSNNGRGRRGCISSMKIGAQEDDVSCDCSPFLGLYFLYGNVGQNLADIFEHLSEPVGCCAGKDEQCDDDAVCGECVDVDECGGCLYSQPQALQCYYFVCPSLLFILHFAITPFMLFILFTIINN